MTFAINNILWTVKYINPNDSRLIRPDGTITVGMTDNNVRTIYLSSSLRGAFLERVLCHELCHCICFSYDIHLPMQTEEIIADWISLYGREVICVLDELLKPIFEKTL